MAFGAVALAFVASTAIAEYVTVEIQRGASELTGAVAPGVAGLAALRGEVRRYVLLADDVTDRGVDGVSQPRPAALDRAHAAMERAWADYRALPLSGDVRAMGDEARVLKDELEAAIARLDGAMAAKTWAEARHTLATELRPAADRLDEALMRLVQTHADHGAAIAAHIQSLGNRSIGLAVGLDAVSVTLAFATALMMVRVVRRYSALVERRADELELFAGRVAHDVLSPLGAASLALDVAAREAPAGSRTARLVVLGQAGLRRARTIADALLEFARAGARPASGEEADVAEIVRAIADEVEPDAKARGVEVRVELGAPLVVTCSAGMLTSIVSNLVRNALKYVGDGAGRRVVVRAWPAGRCVRIEVEDNGPGLPEGLAEKVFEPYVRGPRERAPGVGLGLATVKKITEAHGGRVDVRSAAGVGSRFGVELPAPRTSGFLRRLGPARRTGETRIERPPA